MEDWGIGRCVAEKWEAVADRALCGCLLGRGLLRTCCNVARVERVEHSFKFEADKFKMLNGFDFS